MLAKNKFSKNYVRCIIVSVMDLMVYHTSYCETVLILYLIIIIITNNSNNNINLLAILLVVHYRWDLISFYLASTLHLGS